MKGRIVQRAPGSWQLIYDLPRGTDGKRKQAYKTVKGTEKDAQKELRKRLKEIDDGLVSRSGNVTMADHLEQWLQSKEGSVRLTTHEGLATVVHAHLIPYFGTTKLEALQPPDIREFIKYLREKGNRARGSEGEPLSAASVHRIGSVLKQALKDAVEMEILARNPFKETLPSPKSPKKRVLKPEQIERVMDETRNSYLHIMILLALTTGCRRGEILGLRWEDIDLATGEVSVSRSLAVVKTDEGRKIKVSATKTDAGTRTIYLPEFARHSLIRHRGKQAARRLACGPIWQEHGLVVCGDDGTPIRPSTASVRMKQMMDRLDLNRLTLHGLRHSFASLVLKNGGNLKTLQTMMGHERIEITIGLYGHLLGGEQEAVAAGLHEMLGKVMGGS